MIQQRLRVSLSGDGSEAEPWSVALRQLAQLCDLPEQLPGSIDALVVGPGTRDPFAQTKQALSAGVPVLYAAPFTLGPWQATALTELSRHQKPLLRFAEPFQYRPGFRFLSRLVAGEEALWHPLYVRTLRLAPPNHATSIDGLATEELAMCEALLDRTPQHVSAATGRRDNVGEVCAAFLTVQYADGPLVQCTISRAEAASSSQLVLATQDRTVMLDEQDPVSPLRIIGGADRESSSEDHASWRCRRLLASPDPVGQEVSLFLSALAQDATAAVANGERWARVAALWWAARQSMNDSGPAMVAVGQTEPPPLRVIQGGGKPAPTAQRRPPLTVVAR